MIEIVEILTIIAYIIAAASIVVKATPSTKDDKILGKIKNFISKFVALNPKIKK